MEKIKYKLIPYEITFICDHCHIGELEPIAMNMVLTSYPPKFPHICNHCGVVEDLYESYPKINYIREEIIDENNI